MNARVADNAIVIREQQFFSARTGQRYTPVGMDYYQGGVTDAGYKQHAALLPPYYDKAYVESMMAAAERFNFNTVRVFTGFATGPHGVVVSPAAREINPLFIANLADFLRRARAHHIHVIITTDLLPNSDWLSSMPLPNESHYSFSATQDATTAALNGHLFIGSVRTRANLYVQVINALRRIDPSLLEVVLSWELENESCFLVNQAPLNATQGTFTLGNTHYDLSSDEQKQALMDAIMVQFCNACAGAVHRADPQALVSDSVFTFHAVGRPGPGSISTDNTQDKRVPARPLALAGSSLDFLDIHCYANSTPGRDQAQDVSADLKSDEWHALLPALKRAGKPIIAGEVGVFRNQLRDKSGGEIDVTRGAQVLKEHTLAMKNAGFEGVLYWHYGGQTAANDDSCPPLKFYPEFASALTDVFGTALRLSPTPPHTEHRDGHAPNNLYRRTPNPPH